MNEISLGMAARQCFSQLLQRPLGGGMPRNVEMKNLAAIEVHDNENIKDAEPGCDHGEKVTGYNRLCMIAEEGGPALLGVAAAGTTLANHVLANGTRRETDPDLPLKFIGDPFCAPVMLSSAMRRINARISSGIEGRPNGRDFHFQNSRKPFRCHRTSVSGFTTTRAFCQSNQRLKSAIRQRVASSARYGRRFRS